MGVPYDDTQCRLCWLELNDPKFKGKFSSIPKSSTISQTLNPSPINVVSTNIENQIKQRQFGMSPQTEEKPLPGIMKQLSNFAKSAINHIIHGLPKAEQELAEQRLSICFNCEWFRASDQRCAHNSCGCAVAAKASWKLEKCPIGRW